MFDISSTIFNCTIVELKFLSERQCRREIIIFNCTIVELKFNR